MLKKNITATQAKQILENYNDWRQSKTDELFYTPKSITAALNYAIDALQNEINETDDGK